ncbi:TM2 domain-containing protein [Siculibacillus lacustris]|uniref:TM2 domain-containing protein n=1 Tax=Siculibacillus lacustris TaxID=1549641 RepID=A0A4Q9VUD0_9HYPH|nr:NINE protein [Siculibacillus lacustris]TBW39274.1 TM2 domain-containing protein [Siculibacillus lacustris]
MTISTSDAGQPLRQNVSADAKAMMLFDANKKSVVVAYLFWFFLGGFGAHRFYSGRTGSGIAQLILVIVGIVLAGVGIGLLLLLPLAIWVLVDAFLIPGWISNHNNLLAHSLLSA